MAAPTNVAGVQSGVITTTTGTTLALTVSVGNLILLQVLQDGTGADMTLTDTNSSVEALDGTDNTMTALPGNPYNVGGTPLAKQFVWIGRALTTSVSMDLASSSGNDLYWVVAQFQDVNTGTALSDVIENGTAGNANNGTGDTATVTDTAVTTLSADRLALNLIGVNDDNQLDFDTLTGETGGTWGSRLWRAGSSTGTDGATIGYGAAMASAGTIDGGSMTMSVADAWGNIGFALIGTTAGGGGNTYTKAGFGKESG